jgi:hypothetical protein
MNDTHHIDFRWSIAVSFSLRDTQKASSFDERSSAGKEMPGRPKAREPFPDAGRVSCVLTFLVAMVKLAVKLHHVRREYSPTDRFSEFFEWD